ncbi:hypothetical protein [Mesorhizobium sp. M0276]|uniref:hypothetical protein n=1 Tax=Mesorhizobium sp. M0276 TaxID=2956928 RepID=UPI00333A2BF1
MIYLQILDACADKAITSLLDRLGKTTGRQIGWTQSRVCTFRNQLDIAVYKKDERAGRGEHTCRKRLQSSDYGQ